MRSSRYLIATIVAGILSLMLPAAGQGTTPAKTAIEHVTVLPMDSESELPDQTVVVSDGVIESVSPSDSESLPEETRIIDGTGKYLLPGLVDSHMHLDPLVGARPRFGDGLIYLSYGITTVFNLRGGKADLENRELIKKGEILAPTLYTSGEFVNEPRVNTPAEAAAEVAAQKKEGFDLIKIHQCEDDKTGQYTTTVGMDEKTFMAVNEAAGKEGIPLVGHGPYNLGLDAALEARENIAHIGEFNPLYFLPAKNTGKWLIAASGGVLLLLFLAVCWSLGYLSRLLRHRTFDFDTPRAMISLKRRAVILLFLAVATGVAWFMLMPGGLFTGRRWLLVVEACLAAGAVISSLLVLMKTGPSWKERRSNIFSRAGVLLATAAAMAVTISALYWVPLSWRATDASIQSMAKKCKSSGIWVQSTLVIYDTALSKERLASLRGKDSPLRFLASETRKDWSEWPGIPSWMAGIFGRYPSFTCKVARALHENGVPVMAGTDAMGFPMIIPGESLHRELLLLTESGFTPYEALWSATVAPAKFLKKDGEFGTVRPGARADLILVSGDPLKDLKTLEKPEGVMVRGRWLTREDLEAEMSKLLER